MGDYSMDASDSDDVVMHDILWLHPTALPPFDSFLPSGWPQVCRPLFQDQSVINRQWHQPSTARNISKVDSYGTAPAAPQLRPNSGALAYPRLAPAPQNILLPGMAVNLPAMPVRRATVYSSQEWQAKKDIIYKLWIVENRPWSSSKRSEISIETVLRDEFNFHVTKRQFTRKVEQWGFGKNVKEKEMRAIHKIKQDRLRRFGKSTEFQIRDKEIPTEKQDRWRQRHNKRTRIEGYVDKDGIRMGGLISMSESLKDLPIIGALSYGTPKAGISFDSTPPTEGFTSEGEMALDEVIGTSIVPCKEKSMNPGVQFDEKSQRDRAAFPLHPNVNKSSFDLEAREPTVDIKDPDIAESPKPSRSFVNLELQTGDEIPLLPPSDVVAAEQDGVCYSVNEILGQRNRKAEGAQVILLRPQVGLSPFRILKVTTQAYRSTPEKRISRLRQWEMKWKSAIFELAKANAPLAERLPAISELAWVLSDQNRYNDAERMFRHVAVETSKLYGPTDLRTVEAYCDAIKCLHDQGQTILAYKVNRRLRMTAGNVLSSNQQLLLRTAIIEATIWHGFNNFIEAEKSYREIIRMALTMGGLANLNLGRALVELIKTCLSSGQVSDSILLSVLNLQRAGVLTLSAVYEFSLRHRVAISLQRQGRLSECESMLRRVLVDAEERYGPQHRTSLMTSILIGDCLTSQGNYKEAGRLLEPALQTCQQFYGPSYDLTLWFLDRLRILGYRTGAYEEAVWYGLQLVARCEIALGVGNIRTLRVCASLGQMYYKLQDGLESIKWYRKAAAGYERKYGLQHLNTLKVFWGLGNACFYIQDHRESVTWYQKATAGYEKLYGVEHLDTIRQFHNLGEAYYNVEEYVESMTWLQKAKMGYRHRYDDGHRKVKRVQKWIDKAEKKISSQGITIG